ncbi:MAG TPA: ribulokinase [Anaeromyxobacter sp.]|nr:ribulokinase [Anaeromyxobacter sp.]
MTDACVVGIDFGTDSVRTVVVDAARGAVLGSAVRPFVRWGEGRYCDAQRNQFRQHPKDHLEAMEAATVEALAAAGAARRVVGIAIDTTGSTPALADGRGVPLALTPGFEENPNAMFVLWKDHTAVEEAEEINALARSWGGPDFTRYEGGIYSTEWFWAKAVHVFREDAAVAQAAGTIVEHCDWLPAELTGTFELPRWKRSRCAAGHKAMWHAEWGGYPDPGFLARLHPRLPALRASLGAETFTAEQPFGTLSAAWARRLGLSEKVVVTVGAFDAHMGAVGGGIGPHKIVKIMGTSTCDVVVARRGPEPEKLVRGICGQVDGSVIPGMIGYEAGQSAFGDVYAWFKRLLSWPLEHVLPGVPGGDAAARRQLATDVADRLIPELERAARALPTDTATVLAVDWVNGRRTPDANQRLKGAIANLSLGSDAPRVYRALVEATAFGSRAIVERFRKEGIRIDSAIGIGGVARKSPFVMQTVADVMNMEVAVGAGDQAVALGAAIFAATAAGLYPDVEAAQRAMAAGTEAVYRPDPARARHYDAVYADYRKLGAFVEFDLTRS